MEKILELQDVSKIFGELRANDRISFFVNKGEIHTIVGENGAGKSTLMNIIYGMYQPDEGQMYLNGKEVSFTGPRDALRAGIGMVHQHFMLVPPMSVLDNIIVGRETTQKGCVLNKREAYKVLTELSGAYGLQIDLDKKVRDISVGQKQRVEIVKALYRGAEVLILDEPSAVLTPQEIDQLYEIIFMLKKQGKTILFITHKLDEVKKVSDRTSVLRNGRLIGTVNTADVSTMDITKMMVGHDVAASGSNKSQTQFKHEILKVSHLEYVKDGKKKLDDVSFSVKAGEIFGVAGVDGNGQIELVEVLSGMKKASAGEAGIRDYPILNKPVADIRRNGLSYIPEDRHKHGLVLDYSIEYNLILGQHFDKKYSNKGWIRKGEIHKNADQKISKYDIRPCDPKIIGRNMSGGNQQKVVLAREIDRNQDLIIATQPTRGLDIGAIEFVHKKLIEERNKGKAVLLISFELDEILALSDRIAVIHNGRIVGILDQKNANKSNLGYMMLSGKTMEEEHE